MPCLGDILQYNARCYPNRAAIICNGRSLSYAELDDASGRFAHSLMNLGFGRGSRVAFLMKDSAEWLIAWYACQKLGATVALLHSRLLPEELSRMMELTGASVLIYQSDYSDKAEYIEARDSSLQKCICIGEPRRAGHLRFYDMLDKNVSSIGQMKVDGSEDCVILFTSGTTGVSKGIARTHKMMDIYSRVISDDGFSRQGAEVMLTPAPLYHAAGLCCVIKMARLAGTLVLVDSFCPDKICAQIERYSATQAALVPPRSYQRLKSSGYAAKHDLSSVKLVHLTASKAGRECIDDIFGIFPNAVLRMTWGSTEASNVTFSILTREQLAHDERLYNTVGRVNSVSEILLLDDSGAEVPVGSVGEAYVRSPLVFHGYIDSPAGSAACLHNGWFKTEDLMCRDENGYYYMMGRKRDMIKSGGENVYAQEVEQVIMAHPSVKDCAVVAIPDSKFDEAVGAAIVLKPGCSLSAQELLAFCRGRLPSFKKPRYWALMDALPENDLGKIQKNILRRDYAKLFTKLDAACSVV